MYINGKSVVKVTSREVHNEYAQVCQMWDHLEFSGWLCGRFLIKGNVVEKLPGVLHAPQKGNKWNVVCRERSTKKKKKNRLEQQPSEKQRQRKKRKVKKRKVKARKGKERTGKKGKIRQVERRVAEISHFLAQLQLFGDLGSCVFVGGLARKAVYCNAKCVSQAQQVSSADGRVAD